MLIRDIAGAVVVAVTTWMAAVQTDRSRSSLSVWDGTASSLFVHPPKQPQASDISQAKAIDPSNPHNPLDLSACPTFNIEVASLKKPWASEIAVALLLLVVIIACAMFGYWRSLVPQSLLDLTGARPKTLEMDIAGERNPRTPDLSQFLEELENLDRRALSPDEARKRDESLAIAVGVPVPETPRSAKEAEESEIPEDGESERTTSEPISPRTINNSLYADITSKVSNWIKEKGNLLHQIQNQDEEILALHSQIHDAEAMQKEEIATLYSQLDDLQADYEEEVAALRDQISELKVGYKEEDAALHAQIAEAEAMREEESAAFREDFGQKQVVDGEELAAVLAHYDATESAQDAVITGLHDRLSATVTRRDQQEARLEADIKLQQKELTTVQAKLDATQTQRDEKEAQYTRDLERQEKELAGFQDQIKIAEAHRAKDKAQHDKECARLNEELTPLHFKVEAAEAKIKAAEAEREEGSAQNKVELERQKEQLAALQAEHEAAEARRDEGEARYNASLANQKTVVKLLQSQITHAEFQRAEENARYETECEGLKTEKADLYQVIDKQHEELDSLRTQIARRDDQSKNPAQDPENNFWKNDKDRASDKVRMKELEGENRDLKSDNAKLKQQVALNGAKSTYDKSISEKESIQDLGAEGEGNGKAGAMKVDVKPRGRSETPSRIPRSPRRRNSSTFGRDRN